MTLSLVAAGLTLLGIALGLAVTYWSLVNYRVLDLDDEGRLLANVILEAAVLREDQTVRVPRVAESYLTDEGGVRAAQVYLDGELIWEGGGIDAPRPLDAEKLLAGRGGHSVGDWRVYTLRDEDAGIVVQVGRPLQSVWDVLRPYNEIAAAVTLVLALLSGALAWKAVGLALRPLRRLTEAAEGLGDGVRVPVLRGGDEPAKLARSFAALLDRLQGERERERAFLAYAAHELRTPLSALRAGLEAMRTGRLPSSDALLGRLVREAARLETLAQNLLALSRAEAGEARFQPLDLEDLAAAAYDRFQPLALEKGLELTLAAGAAPVRGDPRLLEQAVDNLVANALRATTRGRIEIGSGVETGRAFLEVRDSGPGLPAQLREGLGLRVARAVARAHRGSLRLENGDGARVRLLLGPAAEEADPPIAEPA